MTGAHAQASRRLSLLAILVFWACIHGGAIVLSASPVLDGGLLDTDSYMRLVRVQHLHDGGAWFDDSVARSNAPYGSTLHWTRPMDVLLLGGAFLLSAFLDFPSALYWAAASVGPLLALATALAVAWAGRPLVPAPLRPLLAVALLIQPAVAAYSMAGRADHHALLLLLFVVQLGLVLRLAMGWRSRGLPLAAGALAAAGVWVGVEFMLAVGIAAAALWLGWLRHGADRLASNLWFATGFVAAIGMALLVERPLASVLEPEYDRLSIVHGVAAAVYAGCWALIAFVAALAGTPSSGRVRFLLSAPCALAGAAALFAVYPKVFAGPTADMDPALVPIWFAKVKELQSVLPSDTESLGRFLLWLGPATICLPYAGLRVRAERSRPAAAGWAYLALAVCVYLVLSVQHIRFAPYAEAAALIPLVSLVGTLRDWLSRIEGETLRGACRAFVTVGLLAGMTLAGALIGYGPGADSGASRARKGGTCDFRRLSAFLDRPEGWGGRPRIILGHFDYGPELLYRTRHSVLAGPYHRNARGILDIRRAFAAREDAASRDVIEARGVDLVLLCPGGKERATYGVLEGRSSFYTRLLEGRVPDWLRPVALPEGLAGDFRLYEVVR